MIWTSPATVTWGGLCRCEVAAILPVDREIAERWGSICGEAERSGRTRPAIDALLAATALVHGLTVATRNVGDFSGTGAALFNPFG